MLNAKLLLIIFIFQNFSNSVQEQLLQAQQVSQNANLLQSTSGLNLAIGASNSNSNNNQDSNLSAASGSSMSSDKESEVFILFRYFLMIQNAELSYLTASNPLFQSQSIILIPKYPDVTCQINIPQTFLCINNSQTG